MIAAERLCPYAEPSRLQLAMPPPKKSGSLARTRGTGNCPRNYLAPRASNAYRRGQIMIDRGISFLTRKLRAPRSLHSARSIERAENRRITMVSRTLSGAAIAVLARRSDAGAVWQPLVCLHTRFALA